jgi:hypothetical protein
MNKFAEHLIRFYVFRRDGIPTDFPRAYTKPAAGNSAASAATEATRKEGLDGPLFGRLLTIAKAMQKRRRRPPVAIYDLVHCSFQSRYIASRSPNT